MKVYWKVHYNNFHDFISHIRNKYGSFGGNLNRFENYYGCEQYIYLGVDDREYVTDDKYNLTYMNCTAENADWYNDDDWIYMGEFNDRKKKLKKLKTISKMRCDE